MGVPKFFRYISERYPCLSEVVREYQLPEFDNLYLDMNGIIHVCSHPNDMDPHFRITEEKIFRDIFHYIESLFRMIQPQKLFFMAVDGVAPRAKMNQQRGRRFRSAKEAEEAESLATLKGEELPSAERFDSNCITPGTEFMVRLHAQLRYFVTFKVSTDKLWQKARIILSGHETPGEGEHKIMDYIRYMKSQPDYDPNTRHCLYGLDADLIMLGLCTHEPRFSLLREEVKYGKKNNQKRIPTPEETTFFLLHLSLMRDYLDLEFQQLKTTLPFPYDLENIIDDWVLMGFLVGNDFIPHLPDMHINKGALPLLYQTYIDVLPTLGGYINEGGSLQLDRFQKYMGKLAGFDMDQFKEYSADLKYFEGKTGRQPGAKERHSYKNEKEPPSVPKNKDLAALIASTDQLLLEGGEDDDDDEYEDIPTEDEDDDDEDDTTMAEFSAMKRHYYMEKLEYEKVTPEVLRSQGEGYVRAIQWNLNYYYNGCCSWSWFYPHHYAPYISDIKSFSNLKLEYDLGQPFLPFQQLLAVLPAASKKLLPPAYHELMENEESPIVNFYPTEFRTDLNGKRQEWEAVVLIPFIEQESLLNAMKTKEHLLTDEEKCRNKHGPMHVFSYTPDNLGSYISPAYFPALANHHAKEENWPREKLYVDNSQLVKGLCPGVSLNIYFPGFPTLKHVAFTARLEKGKVKVFESPSMGDNMMLTVSPQDQPEVSKLASLLLGKSVFVNWPHLFEARAVMVATEDKRFVWQPEDNSIFSEEMTKSLKEQWVLSEKGIKDKYLGRLGIDVGEVQILVYACTLEDRKFVMTDNKMICEKQWSKFPTAYPLQTTKIDIEVYEPVKNLTLTVEQLFPPGIVVFLLDPKFYGAKGVVEEYDKKNQRVRVLCEVEKEPNFEPIRQKLRELGPKYSYANAVAQKLNMSPHLLSRVTGTIFMALGAAQAEGDRSHKLNIALNLKFNKRNEEVCGYSKKDRNNIWMYSERAVNEVLDYSEKFPEVFNFLKDNTSSENVRAEDLYPEDTAEKMKALGAWLKERDSNKAERQTCGAQVLEEEVVSALEQAIQEFTSVTTVTSQVLHIKPSSLYIPKTKLGQAADPKATHQLFDRIINVRESYTVPLGAKGTIIGIHDPDKGPQAIYDVVFDKEFTGGLKLRCSAHRGYRLPSQAFINISYGKLDESGKCSHRLSSAAQLSGSPSSYRSPTEDNRGGGRKAHNNRGNDSPARSQAANNPDFNLAQQQQQQLSDEYLAMFKQLQVSNHGSKSHNSNSRMYGAPPLLPDPSNALKKMLKIADEPNKKPSSSDNRFPVPVSSNFSFCAQLLGMHQQRGLRLPRYLYSDTSDGTIICTVICGNNQEFMGVPSYANDPAAETAARAALQCLGMEELRPALVPNVSSYYTARLPLQRPGFATANRFTQEQFNNYRRQPAKPVNLPQPPTTWYQHQRVANLQPDWKMGGGTGRSDNLSFTPRFQHNNPPQQAPVPQNNQQGQGKSRQPPARRDPPSESTPSEASNTREKPTQRRPPAGAINTSGPPRSRIAANFNQPFKFSNSSSPQNSQ